MLKTLKLINLIENRIKINALIYVVKQLPLIKTLFHSFEYFDYSKKEKMTILAVFLEFLKQQLIVCVSFLLGIGLVLIHLPKYIEGIQIYDAFLTMFFCFYFILGALTNSLVFERSEGRYICVKRFHMDAKEYFLAQFLNRHLWNLIGEIPVFSFTLHYFGIDIIPIIILLIIKEIFGAFGEMLHILLYEKKNKIIDENIFCSFTLKLVVIVSGYLSVILLRDFHYSSFFLIAAGTLALAGGVIGILYLLRYQNYYEICQRMDTLDELAVDGNEIEKNMHLSKIQKEHISEKKSETTDISDNPFEYITALFFKRHKKLIYKPIVTMVVLAMLLLLVSIGCKLWGASPKVSFEAELLKYYSNVILIIYGFSNVRKVTKIMFYNCDCNMLQYTFYKEKLALVATYLSRLTKLIAANILPCAAFGMVLIIDGFLFSISLQLTIIISIFMVMISIFFTVHELFLYYMLQPFHAEKSVSKPTYSFIQMLTASFCVAAAQLPLGPLPFLILAVVITILYMGISTYLVFRFGEKTFCRW